jgi:outer membrane protein assembly factor BamB
MPLRRRPLPIVLALAVTACGGEGGGEPDPDGGPDLPAPELGTGDHSPASVGFTTIATADDGLAQPRDLAFNPRRPDELWIVSFRDDSTVIVHDASTDDRQAEYRKDPYALHFMAEATAIAFGQDETSDEVGAPGTFATCGESRNTYDDMAPPNDFMGPTLWSSDLSIYALSDPNGLGTHLDMLHCSPNCMGLAWVEENVYWAFDGLHGALVLYDFAIDNGIGQDDHTDGSAQRYVEGQVLRSPGVPSHLVYDPSTHLLFVADSGHGRIAALDTLTGTAGAPLEPYEPMALYRYVDDAVLTDVVPDSSEDLDTPSGIELHDGLLFVTDNANGRISAFTKEGGRVNWLDTGLAPGSLGGIAFGPDGKIYFADLLGERVLRVDP